MRLKRRRLSNFEACSVALFTSLALGGAATAARTQTASIHHSISAGPSDARSAARSGLANSAQTSRGATRAPIPPNDWPPERPAQALKRSDGNGGVQLSRQEAPVWSGPSRHFDQGDAAHGTSYSTRSRESDLSRRVDQSDAGKDGSISSAEFDESLK